MVVGRPCRSPGAGKRSPAFGPRCGCVFFFFVREHGKTYNANGRRTIKKQGPGIQVR